MSEENITPQESTPKAKTSDPILDAAKANAALLTAVTGSITEAIATLNAAIAKNTDNTRDKGFNAKGMTNLNNTLSNLVSGMKGFTMPEIGTPAALNTESLISSIANMNTVINGKAAVTKSDTETIGSITPENMSAVSNGAIAIINSLNTIDKSLAKFDSIGISIRMSMLKDTMPDIVNSLADIALSFTLGSSNIISNIGDKNIKQMINNQKAIERAKNEEGFTADLTKEQSVQQYIAAQIGMISSILKTLDKLQDIKLKSLKKTKSKVQLIFADIAGVMITILEEGKKVDAKISPDAIKRFVGTTTTSTDGEVKLDTKNPGAFDFFNGFFTMVEKIVGFKPPKIAGLIKLKKFWIPLVFKNLSSIINTINNESKKMVVLQSPANPNEGIVYQISTFDITLKEITKGLSKLSARGVEFVRIGIGMKFLGKSLTNIREAMLGIGFAFGDFYEPLKHTNELLTGKRGEVEGEVIYNFDDHTAEIIDPKPGSSVIDEIKVFATNIGNINNQLMPVMSNLIKMGLLAKIVNVKNVDGVRVVFLAGVSAIEGILAGMSSIDLTTNDLKKLEELKLATNSLISVIISLRKLSKFSFDPLLKIGLKNFVEIMKDVQNITNLINQSGNGSAKNAMELAEISEKLLIIGINLFKLSIMANPLVIAGLFIFKLIINQTVEILTIINNLKIEKQASETLRSISVAFLGFALSIALISLVTLNPVAWAGFGMFVLMIGATVGVLYLISLIEKDSRRAAKALMFISFAFLGFALSIVLLSLVTLDDTVWRGFGMFVLMVGAAVGAMYLISMIDKQSLRGAAVLAIISIAFLGFSLSMLVISQMQNEISWDSIMQFSLLVGVAVGIAFLLNFVKKQAIVGALVLAVVSLALLASSFILSEAVRLGSGFEWGDLGKASALIGWGVAITGVLGLLVTSGFGAAVVLGGAALLVSIGVSMAAFALSMQEIIKTSKEFGELNDVNGVMDKIIDPMIYAVDKISGVGVVKLTKAMFKLGELAIISAEISKMASNLADIASLKIPISWDGFGWANDYRQMTAEDFVLAKNNTTTVMTALIEAVNNPEVERMTIRGLKSSKKKFKQLSKISEFLSNSVKAISDLASLKVATEWNEETGAAKAWVTLDETHMQNAMKNASTLVGLLPDIVDKACTMNLAKVKVASKVLKKLSPVTDVLTGLVTSITELGSGRIATKYDDKTGEAIEWMDFSEYISQTETKDGVTYNKVGAVLTQLISTYLDAVTGVSDKDSGGGWFSKSKLEQGVKNIKEVSEITGPVGAMIDGMTKIDVKADYSQVGAKISQMFTALFASVDLLNYKKETIDLAEDNLDLISKIVAESQKIKDLNPEKIKNHKSFIDNNIKFIDKINTVNVSKLKTAVDMFKQMAEFSKSISGDFKGLADVLNEKLMELLTQLKDLAERNTQASQPAPIGSGAPGKTFSSMIPDNKKLDISEITDGIEDIIEQIDKLNRQVRVGIKINNE